MKKIVSITLALVLLSSVVSMAAAQGTRSTAFQIVNLGTNPADITVYYFRASDGGQECQDTVNDLGSFKSVQFNQGGAGTCISGETTWQGSVVIESTEPIAVITNINELPGAGANVMYAGGSYRGIADTKTGTEVVLPFVMHDYYGYNTDFAVQNAGGADATVHLDYYKTGSATIEKTEGPSTVKPGASLYRDQLTADTDLGATWSGVVVVRSTQPVAAVVNENPAAQGQLLNYEGFSAGGTTIVMPFLAKTFYGFNTAFQLVSMEAGTAGTISFYKTGEATASATVAVSLGKYESLEWNMQYKLDSDYTSGGISDSWSGAGVVNLTSGSAVVIVNERGVTGAGTNLGLTYSGMDTGGLKDNMTFPFVIKNYTSKSWNTAFQVINTGTPGTVTVYYDAAEGSGLSSYTWTSPSLGTNEALECNQQYGACIASPLPDQWVGSVRVEGATGVLLAGICNERSDVESGDAGLVYNGFPFD